MRRVVCGVAGALLLATSGLAAAPEGRFVSQDELRAEAKDNCDLSAYIDRNGVPEMAEVKVLSDRPPWDDHEVVLYYLKERLEISFARALALGKADIPIIRYERQLTDADVQALETMAPEAMATASAAAPDESAAAYESASGDESASGNEVDWSTAAAGGSLATGSLDTATIPTTPGERAEAAADRAELAAGRVELAADRTEKAATRAESAFDQLAAKAAKSRR